MKNKNIWLLPTKKMSRLYLRNGVLKMDNSGFNLQLSYQNIYITSDEEIKDVRPHKGKWQLEKGQILNKFPNYLTDLPECKLVILTTDPDLIKDGVQAIDDTFLEWFVKNPSCEKVDVRKWFGGEDFLGYKIIIPQEEPKQDTQFLVDYANGLDYAAQWHKKNFIDGPKLQVERMYSEEDIMNALHSVELKHNKDYSKIYNSMKEFLNNLKK